MIALWLALTAGWAQESPPPLAIPGPDTQNHVLPGRLPWKQRVVGEAAVLLRYSMAIGVGNTADYVDRFSFLGATAQFTYFAAPGLSVGALGGWQTLYDREKSTEVQDNVTITATQIRYLDLIPIVANAQYYLGNDEETHPYVGVGVGAWYTKRETWISTWTILDDSWRFGVSPEVGLMVTTGGTEIVVDAKFHYLAPGGGYKSETLLTFEIGAMVR